MAKEYTYDCRDEGYNCGWTCEADSQAELDEKVNAHIAERHGMGNLDMCGNRTD